MDQDDAGNQPGRNVDRQSLDFFPVSLGQTHAAVNTAIAGCPETGFDPESRCIGTALRVATPSSSVRKAIAPPSGTPMPVFAYLALLPNPGFRKSTRIFESHANERSWLAGSRSMWAL
jgi:hypothetical protein